MNTTRTIRIATGTKRVELASEKLAILQIREILKEHRDSLIFSLVSDLETYIKYKFSTPPTKGSVE